MSNALLCQAKYCVHTCFYFALVQLSLSAYCSLIMLFSVYPFILVLFKVGPLRSWSYGSWIYNYLCSQFLHHWSWCCEFESHWGDTTLCEKVCQWLVTGQWYFPGTLVFFTNNTDHNHTTEILLKVALNTISQTNQTNV